jgi:hypothetical protein
MDWMGTINAHALWKRRLQSLLDGNSTESLDPVVIGLDNGCELGQWLHGEGQTHRQEEKFEEVRLMHADFHRLAAEIVSLHQSGYPEAAAHLLNGDYAKLCERLKHRILSLSNQIKPKEG